MNVEGLVLVAGAALLLSGRTVQVLTAYVVLAALSIYYTLPVALESPAAEMLFALSSILKLVIAPLMVWLFVRYNPDTRDLRPSIPIPARLLLVILFAAAAHALGAMPAFKGIAMVEVSAYVILCALGMLIVQRNLLAHILGLLALSAGIALAGAAFAPKLPETVEFGATFDALVVTFIGLAILRAFLAHNPLLDVDSLKSLRG